MEIKSLCVYTGSSNGSDAIYLECAREFGAELGARGMRLVYGGASVGLMGAVADGALAAGGEVVGVLTRALAGLEVAHENLTQLDIVETMHERKAAMADLADGFVALPGGLGTLEELFEAWTWLQLNIHSKPVGCLNVGGYYDHLLKFLDGTVSQGFVRPAHRQQLLVDVSAPGLLDQLLSFQGTAVAKLS
ncbi:MAG: TIGR00730 family Rossman fold protein [Pseudomonadota bacterium]